MREAQQTAILFPPELWYYGEVQQTARTMQFISGLISGDRSRVWVI
jgi:hypothetical protein